MVIGEASTGSGRRVIVWVLAAAAVLAVVLLAVPMVPSDMARADWRLASDVAPADSVFQIEVALRDNCERVHTLAVGEHDEVVRVDAFVVESPYTGVRGCESTDRSELMAVYLSEPLGDRRVVGCSTAEQAHACTSP